MINLVFLLEICCKHVDLMKCLFPPQILSLAFTLIAPNVQHVTDLSGKETLARVTGNCLSYILRAAFCAESFNH